MNDTTTTWTIPAEADGWRLDKALELLFPKTGLRGRRRLIESGAVTVGGKARTGGYRTRAGEAVTVALVAGERQFSTADTPVVLEAGPYALVSKPAGLHTAALSHGGGECLESMLPELFPGRTALLLSRLDRLTTGLLPVAFSEAAATAYRDMEEGGQVAKTYLAVGHGRAASRYFRVENDLDAAARRKTRVLLRPSIDSLRVTEVEVAGVAQAVTLFRCGIKKGARHQIRAHLAHAGHPLVGDPLYGRGEGGRLYLHCAGIDCPAFTAQLDAPWTLEEASRIVAG
jgi:23S rRNA pseudouridine1911/1915/1917 synthase